MRFYDCVLNEEKESVKRFLKTFDLTYEDDIDETVYVKENNQLIATASLSQNIIKCIAVADIYQGKNYLALLMSEMIKRLNEKGINHYFVYTLDEHVHLFKALGFTPVVQTMTLAILEGGKAINTVLTQLKSDYEINNTPKACVVINANPLTNGHLALIEKAVESQLETLVFVVSEDRSVFPFKARFEIIKKACQKYTNVTVLPTLNYLVSYATFPKYFLKDEIKIREEHALLDVMIFKNYYMKVFNIKKRYVGDEPLSPMTNMYNKTMQKYLKSTLEIMPRVTYKQSVISASKVRGLLKQGSLDDVSPYVPKATLEFLKSKEGTECIAKIKTTDQRH